MKTEVFCTLQIEGLHNWPSCPYLEVDYLTVPHRHVFHIKAYKEVFHDDRDQEFIMLKHMIQDHFKPYYSDAKHMCDFGAMSCEMIARQLVELFRLTRCEVSEDGENGAVVTA